MTELVKTRAIVLRKINFGDTSRIANFFSEDYGKIPIIIKGARSPKSKIGLIVDTLNLVEVVLYKKDTREIQISSQVELLQYFSNIREDYNKLTFATAIIELLNSLLMENEPHKKLFEGTLKMLSLIDSTNENPKLLFVKYFLFFLKEIGYDFRIENCNACGKQINIGEEASFNYEAGLLCQECRKERLTNFNFNSELVELLFCLRTKKICNYTEDNLDFIIKMLEKILSYHIHEFKGIRSIKFN